MPDSRLRAASSADERGEGKENDRKYVDAVNSGIAQQKRRNEKEELLTEHQVEPNHAHA